MKETNKICPLPWLHLSSNIDTSMRLCCNTYSHATIYKDDHSPYKLSDIENVNEFFNIPFYKSLRKAMINGEEPEICLKCYDTERYGGLSVRQGYWNSYKNDETFLRSLKETNSEGAANISVQSFDSSMSNNCNLKCIMCNPVLSYPIKSDYKKLNWEYNEPVTEEAKVAWSKKNIVDNVIPQISNTLRQYLVTGGEPFLNKDHVKVLKKIVEAGNAENVSLVYHTNSTVINEELFDIWYEFKVVYVHFSIDAVGSLDEYIRYNTKWNKVEEVVKRVLSHPKTNCEIHTCVQMLNIFNITDVYDFSKNLGLVRLPFHIWLDQPDWLMLKNLPVDHLKLAKEKIETYFIKTNNFSNTHTARNQILSYIDRSISENASSNLSASFRKIREIEDVRKLASIETIVPEFQDLI